DLKVAMPQGNPNSSFLHYERRRRLAARTRRSPVSGGHTRHSSKSTNTKFLPQLRREVPLVDRRGGLPWCILLKGQQGPIPAGGTSQSPGATRCQQNAGSLKESRDPAMDRPLAMESSPIEFLDPTQTKWISGWTPGPSADRNHRSCPVPR